MKWRVDKMSRWQNGLLLKHLVDEMAGALKQNKQVPVTTRRDLIKADSH